VKVRQHDHRPARPEAADTRLNLAHNYYGELTRRQWEGCLPGIYQQIRDPARSSPCSAR